MTHTDRNRIAKKPTSNDVRFGVRFAFLGLTVLVCPTVIRAVEPVSGPLLSAPSKGSEARDIEVEIRARAALWKDDSLRRLNLGVKMTSGIAHISGPVPSVEMRKRAVNLVGQIIGVLEVRTEQVYIAKGRDPVKPLALPLEDDKPTRTRSASVHAGTLAPSTLTGRTPSVPQRVTLLAPEAVATVPGTPKSSRATANPRPPKPVESLSVAIDRLRQRDERFRKIRTDVSGGTVRIHSGDASGENVMRFAQALTHISGVERVVVDPSGQR